MSVNKEREISFDIFRQTIIGWVLRRTATGFTSGIEGMVKGAQPAEEAGFYFGPRNMRPRERPHAPKKPEYEPLKKAQLILEQFPSAVNDYKVRLRSLDLSGNDFAELCAEVLDEFKIKGGSFAQATDSVENIASVLKIILKIAPGDANKKAKEMSGRIEGVVSAAASGDDKEGKIKDVILESLQVFMVDWLVGCMDIMLRNNRTLKSLDLSGCLIGRVDVGAFAKGLGDNKTLQELNLSNNKIGDAAAQNIVAVLDGNKTGLRRLNLSSNLVGNEGALAVVKALKDNGIFEELDLSGNMKIGREGFMAIGKALEGNTGLRKLNLRDLGRFTVSPGDLQRFAVSLSQSNVTELKVNAAGININICKVEIDGEQKTLQNILDANKARLEAEEKIADRRRFFEERVGGGRQEHPRIAGGGDERRMSV